MKLILPSKSFIVICASENADRFIKSTNSDFPAVNFDTMELIGCVKMPKSLMTSSFAKSKGTQVLYQNLRSNMVEVTGLEPEASCSQMIEKPYFIDISCYS